MIRICQLCAVDFTLDRFLLPLVDGMRAAGWDVIAVCSDGPFVAPLRARGYDIQTVPVARSLNPFAHAVTIVRLIRLFRRERIDVVHVHTPVAALLGRLAARLAGVPLSIYTAHGFYFHDEMGPVTRRIAIALEWLGGRWTDFLFTQSAEDAVAAVREGIGSTDRVLAIGNGVDPLVFDPASSPGRQAMRASLGIPRDAYVFGMIGRQVLEKGVAEFLRAAVEIARRHSHAWFLLVGDRLASDHAADVTENVARAREELGPRLIVTGARTDIPAVLTAMDVFCLPSWREGMPRTIIEAMMMAKPVIATNIRGAREEVVDGTTGLLVPTRSPEKLAGAMRRLIESPEWAASLGTAGRARALELYDERRIVALQIEQLTRLLDGRGRLAQAAS